MAKYNQDGQCEVDRVELVFPDQVIDLRNIFMDITIYESIFTPTISGNVSIVDTNGLINSDAIGNGEKIRIYYKTSGSKNKVKYEGEVYKISPPTRVSEKSTGIIIYFTSEEFVKSSRARVQEGYNSIISNTVQSLFNKFKVSKNLELVPTSSIEHVVGAGQNPIELIYALARRSKSSGGEYGYIFYEDTAKFNFKPVENLFKQEPVSKYTYKNRGIYDDVKKREEESFNTFQDYDIFEVPDLLAQIADGVYGANVVNLNLMEKELTRITYDSQSDFNTDKSLGRVANQRLNLINQEYEDRKEIFVGDYYSDTQHSRFKNYMVLMNLHKLGAKATVFGDSSLRVGQVLECDLPIWSQGSRKASRKVADPYSGKVLIAEIKHVIKKTAYTQTMKLVKNSFEVGYE